jgi:uncharacterized repeat protein (TIGR01451 family)
MTAFIQAAPPPLAVYDTDCATPKTSFNLGEELCVKIAGAAVGDGYARNRVVLANPAGFPTDVIDVTTSSQTITFMLPSAKTNGDVDNRGTWLVGIVDTVDANLIQAVPITVHDPAQQVADLTITKLDISSSAPVAGSNISYQIYIWNRGPDAATNVQFSDHALPNTTFVSLTQTSGPAFTCTTTAGVTTCNRGTTTAPLTLDKGASASFTAVYLVNESVTNGAALTDTVDVTSQTFDSQTSTNSSTVETTASNPTTSTCTLACPSNIVVVADTTGPGIVNGAPATVSGANVTLPAATTSSSCGAVTSSAVSGSFFPLGSTPVTYTTADGAECNFVVTVTSSGSPVSISCPANITANADADCEVTVTLGTPATTGDSVTVTSVRSDGKPLNAPFTSGVTTVTWTASNSSGTESCTQTVTILDVTPPVINVPAPPTAFTDANCQAVIPDLTGSPGITDNCACDSSDSTEACAGHARVAVTQSPAAGTLVGVGVHAITLTANDGSDNNGGAGNTTIAQVQFTVADNTPPVISCPANIVIYLPLNSPATSMAVSYPAATATDSCGVASIGYSKASGSTFNVGTTTVTATATDVNGNTASCAFTVSVRYNFTGFFSPVSNPQVVNSVNAGRAIPVKFSLSGNKGLNIFATDSPSSAPYTCGSVSTVDVSQTVEATSNSINYDASADQYNYVWKTDSSWAGQCRTLSVTFNDGTTRTALFKFK